tara:strand:- start:290 stop:628 length:339 start_codon:yes stop_codon:yes gene_type:complete
MIITKSKIRQIVQEQFDRAIHERETAKGGPRIESLKDVLSKSGLVDKQKEVAEAIIQAALIKVAPLQDLINMAVNAVKVKPDQETREAAALAVANKLKKLARDKRKTTVATR